MKWSKWHSRALAMPAQAGLTSEMGHPHRFAIAEAAGIRSHHRSEAMR
jgi:hypothetical protein